MLNHTFEIEHSITPRPTFEGEEFIHTFRHTHRLSGEYTQQDINDFIAQYQAEYERTFVEEWNNINGSGCIHEFRHTHRFQ